MNHERAIRKQRQRRRFRVRKHIRGTDQRPRLCVFRSHKHIYAQVVDDLAGKTLAAASTRDQEIAGKVKYGGNTDAATQVGQVIAQRAKAAGIEQVAFDRGHFQYHGRVAALAHAAREAGLKF
ncbi:MAG: 50S ribosomal protein L18 [Planctomycetota bacterium]|nr:50S ribosomal protein L18 [Planctomycetota bacterium]